VAKAEMVAMASGNNGGADGSSSDGGGADSGSGNGGA
jgi:hypothetical protein